MGFKMPHIAVIIGLVCAAVALVFQIVAVAAVGWVKTASQADMSSGLWSSCMGGACSEITASMPDWFQATRAFAIIGLLFIVLALVIGVFGVVKDNKSSTIITAVLAIAAAFCLLISFAVFAGERDKLFPKEYFDLSYCFALTIVAFLLCIATGICFIVPKILGGY